MTEQQNMTNPPLTDAPDAEERRRFLRGLGKWSQAVIGGVLLGSALLEPRPAHARSWANRAGGGGGGWVNRYGGGGGGWVNRAGGGGGAWVNRYGGGSGAWVNRRY